MLDNMSAGLSGAAPAQGVGEVEQAGQGFIGTLFGQRGGQVADVVATHGGIKKASATSLLSIAGAMILGWLGQRVARGGLDATSLGSMLSNARGELGRIAPPGLAGAIGAPSGAERVAEPAGAYAASAATGREAIYHYPAEEAVARKAAAPGLPRWLSWLIPALIVLALLAWLLSRLHFGAPQVPRPTIQAPTLPAPTAPAPSPRAPAAPTVPAPQAQAPAAPQMTAPAAPTITPNAPVQPGGAAPNLAPNSPVSGLADYLDNPNAPAGPQRFTLRTLTFSTADSALSAPSQRVLGDVAAILRAHPNARVQIQGFTDASGSPQVNMALSQQRAESVRSALIQQGVAPDHVTARGFGANNPVADNAAPTGRAENRRTDILVLSR
jgi:outer membrane protein OmpA-like peptidoglycan-associated protein